MKGRKPIRLWLLCLLAIMMILPMRVFAAGKVNTDADVSITVEFKNSENVPLRDVSFRLFKAADVSEYGEYTLRAGYGDSSVIMESNMTNEEWANLLKDLSEKVLSNEELKPLATGNTGDNGILVFTKDAAGNSLTPGMYLVLGSSRRYGDDVYTPNPSMIQVPTTNSEINEWVYNGTVAPKPTYKNDPEDDRDDRPTPTPTQPTSNIPEDPTPLSENPDMPTVEITDNDTPLGSVLGAFDDFLPQGLLPATGTLWWLVPILAYVGIFLFVTGFYRNWKSRKSER